MRWIRILAFILGAVWFFPVSCSTGVVLGIQVIAKLDERETSKGDQVHPHFSVVVEQGENGSSFLTLGLGELSHFKGNSEGYSFLMSKPSGKIDCCGSHFSYQVLEDSGSEQVIEVVEAYHDGDNTIWSRYRATPRTITPESSRMMYFGYLFGAIPYSFGMALLLYVVGLIMRQRLRKTNQDGKME